MEQELEAIQERNRRVEIDKAWETSITRRAIIAVTTYAVAVVWLFVINNGAPFLNALVPAVGYILSTLSLPVIKQWWVKNKFQ